MLSLQRECVWHFLTMSPKSPKNGAQIYVIWERLTSQAAPKGAQSDHQDPKMSPKVARRLSIKSHGIPEGSQRLPKGCPKGPKCRQKAFTKSPKRSQRVPKGPQGGSKAPQSEEIKKLDPIIRDFYSLRCLQRHAHAEKGRMYSFAILQIFPASLPPSLHTSIRTIFLCGTPY